MAGNNHVIFGLKEENFIPTKKTLGQYIFECLRKRNRDDVINIDPLTSEVLTCGALLEKAVKLITILKNHGVHQGDVISISSENSIEYCIPLVAAFAMGVTTNLLNANYAIGEISLAFKIAKPKLVICSETTLANVNYVVQNTESITAILLMGAKSNVEVNSDVVSLNALLELTEVDVDRYQPEEFDCSKQGVLIALSSGTTGLPKGVLVTHEKLKAYMNSTIYGGISTYDTLIGIAPFYFIFGLFVQISALIYPIKVIVLNKFNPHIFLHTIQTYKVTQLVISPSLVLFIAKSPLIKNYDLSSLKDIISGGAPLGSDVQEEASRALGNVRIRQAYGLTEIGPCAYQPQNSPKQGTIGVVVPNYEAKVWDAHTNKNVGPFTIGELCFKGQTEFKGYIDNENIKDVDREGFFHTEDIGYYDEDGYFYITGRTKELIKYKGFQVAPVELENLLLEHPDIKDCAVIGIPNERAGELPCGLVVLRDSSSITEQKVIKYVADRISIQKQLHGGVLFVNEIPRNASGKILRAKLHDMYKPFY